MIISFFRTIVWLLAIVFVVQMGWDEPLRYRTMTPQEIASEEKGLEPPPPSPRSSMSDWRPMGSALDRAPYRRMGNGGIIYSRNVDPNYMGPVTETQRRGTTFVVGAGGYGSPQLPAPPSPPYRPR
jgi:hypothetical protein